MDNKELKKLEDPNNWDDESAEVHSPVQNPRAVVSVSFSRDDLSKVSEAARSQGKKVSAYIREAALEKATRASQHGQSGHLTINTSQSGRITQDFTASAVVRWESHQLDSRKVTSE